MASCFAAINAGKCSRRPTWNVVMSMTSESEQPAL